MWHVSTGRRLRHNSNRRRSRTPCRVHGASFRAAIPTARTSVGARSESPAAAMFMRTTPVGRATAPVGRPRANGPA